MSGLTPAAERELRAEIEDDLSDDLNQAPFAGRIQPIDPGVFDLSIRHNGHSWGQTGSVGMTIGHAPEPAVEYECLTRGDGRRLWLCAGGAVLVD